MDSRVHSTKDVSRSSWMIQRQRLRLVFFVFLFLRGLFRLPECVSRFVEPMVEVVFSVLCFRVSPEIFYAFFPSNPRIASLGEHSR